jgi:hypothetical protein
MSFSFAQLKADTRQAIHGVFAVPATYQDDPLVAPISVRARIHSRTRSPLEDTDAPAGFALVVENAERVVFEKAELTALGITPERGATITFPDYNLTVRLDQRDPEAGPIIESWVVTR